MFSRTVAFLSCTLAMSALAAATPAGLGDLGLGNLGNLGGQGGQGGYPPVTTTVTAPGSGATAISPGKCSTGQLQCCNQTQKVRVTLKTLLDPRALQNFECASLN